MQKKRFYLPVLRQHDLQKFKSKRLTEFGHLFTVLMLDMYLECSIDMNIAINNPSLRRKKKRVKTSFRNFRVFFA